MAGVARCSGVLEAERRRHHGGQPRHDRGHQPAARRAVRAPRLDHHRGFKFLLEIARQSVPEGYGNSYFWVKPRAHRARCTWCARSRERLDYTRRRAARRSTTTRPKPRLAGSASAASTASACASCTPTPTRRTSSACARCSARVIPSAVVSISSRGAARVPRVRARGDDAGRCLRQAARRPLRAPRSTRRLAELGVRPGDAVLHHEVQRRRGVGARGRHQPITTC